MLSPDGTHYAYDAQDGIHDVDLASGADRLLLSNAPGVVFQYAKEGIYISKYGAYAGHLGLWRLNPQTSALAQVLPEGVAFDQLGSGSAWYVEPRSEGPQATTLTRIDLSTGERQVWSSRPNTFVVHLGTDPAGRPLVGWADLSNGGDEKLLIMTGPGQGTVIHTGPPETSPWIVGATDMHGVWFESETLGAPLWLLQADDAIVKVALAPASPLGSCN
jgi:hypothetical protein